MHTTPCVTKKKKKTQTQKQKHIEQEVNVAINPLLHPPQHRGSYY